MEEPYLRPWEGRKLTLLRHYWGTYIIFFNLHTSRQDRCYCSRFLWIQIQCKVWLSNYPSSSNYSSDIWMWVYLTPNSKFDVTLLCYSVRHTWGLDGYIVAHTPSSYTVKILLYKILVRVLLCYSDSIAVQLAHLLSLLCLFSLSVSVAYCLDHSFSFSPPRFLPFLSDFNYYVCHLLHYIIFKNVFSPFVPPTPWLLCRKTGCV